MATTLVEKKVSEEARFQYRCRLCGEVYTDGSSGTGIAYQILISTVLGVKLDRIMGIPPQLLSIHAACKMGLGVSDLLGYVVEKDEK